MHVIAENLFQKDSERFEVPSQKGRAVKRSEPGDEPNPSAPDMVGEGPFKAGTTHKDGIVQCPSDVSYDINEGEGHTQSSTLDKVAEILRKLKQMQNSLVGDSKADA